MNGPTVRLVPVVVLVDEQTARRLDVIASDAESHVEFTADTRIKMARNGWTMTMMVGGNLMQHAVDEYSVPT